MLTPLAGDDDVNIIFGDRSITAATITVHFTEDLHIASAEAEGNVILYDGGKLAFADHAIYDASSVTFTLTNARYNTDDYFMSGKTIEMQPDNNIIVIREGSLTTCDLWEPHYLVVADKIVVKPGVRFWTYGTTYRVNDYPVAWLPYFTRSLQRKDYAFFLYPGYSNRKGAIVNSRALYHHSAYIRPNVYVDYFSELGVGVGFSNEYHLGSTEGEYDRVWGRLYGYYIDQDRVDGYLYEGSRHKIAGYHWQELPWDLTLSGRFQELSDRDFNQDYEQEERGKGWESAELEFVRNSWVNMSRRRDMYTARVTARKNLNDFFLTTLPEVERMPEVHFEAKRDRLLSDFPIYYHASAAWADLRREAGGGVGGEETFFIDEVQRADLDTEFWLPFNLGALRTIPFVNLRATDYRDPESRRWSLVDRPADPVEDNLVSYGFDDTTRLMARGGAHFQTRLVRPFDNFLSGSYDEARLVVQPRFTVEGWTLSDDLNEVGHDGPPSDWMVTRLTEEGVTFPFIDQTDAFREDDVHLGYRLDARMQGKRGGASRDVARAALSSGYYTQRARSDEHEDLVAEFFLYPKDWLTFASYTQYDLNNDRTAATYASVSFIDTPLLPGSMVTVGWSEYEPIEGDGQSNLSLDVFHPISDKWSLALENRFDIDDRDNRKNRLRLTRDLHDWWWDFMLKHEDRAFHDSEFEVSTRIRLKLPGQEDVSLDELSERRARPY